MVLTCMYSIYLHYRMDNYMIQPLYLKILQRLLDNVAPQWCVHNLLAPFLECANTLMAALVMAFGTTEMEMRLCVKRALLDPTPKVNAGFGDWL